MRPAARLADVTIRRGRSTVLSDVALDVHAGELLAIVGPNGAGKSSLLAALSGDLRPSAGEVTVDGRSLGQWSPRDLARRRAVLLQQSAVAFPFTAAEVVRMGRAPWRGTGREVDDDAAVAAALQVMDVAQLAHRPVTALSGGEQARVALARTLAQDTDLLLLDEPTAALDLHHAETTLLHLRSLTARGTAVVVVLHDLNLAAAHADRVALVADGGLSAVGGPHDVLDERLLAQAYGHPVDVVAHPRTGQPVVLPRR
jgi:iron complex transport system ATP-binding protein